MKKLGLVLFVALFVSGCAQRYYTKSNLNIISIGQTKQQILGMFPGEKNARGAPAMLIRAAQKSKGKIIEIGEVSLIDRFSNIVAYWFLFEDGVLAQWGQPEDWKEVKARYEINYNPPNRVTN